MRVGCWDCEKGDPVTERPRKDDSDWDDTVGVCESCREKWLEKHPEQRGKNS